MTTRFRAATATLAIGLMAVLLVYAIHFMLNAQIVLAGLALVLFVILPQMRRLRDTKLALWVESKCPALQHRLISALELNQPGAKTEAMSREMVAAVTIEAVEHTRPLEFAMPCGNVPLADSRSSRGVSRAWAASTTTVAVTSCSRPAESR